MLLVVLVLVQAFSMKAPSAHLHVNTDSSILALLSDRRRGTCYLEAPDRGARRGACSVVLGSGLTRDACCCSVGRGWGDSPGVCEACPRNGTSTTSSTGDFALNAIDETA